MNTENLLKQILHPNNLNQAYLQVKRNKGAAGVDGMTINELGHYLKENGEEIKDQIRTRSYHVRPAWVLSNGLKSRVRPSSGKYIA